MTQELRKKITELKEIDSADEFEKWHQETCEMIILRYKKDEHALCYGQAQKWVNMLLKNIYAYNIAGYTDFFDKKEHISFLHVTIDNRIISDAKSQFNVNPPSNAWSKMNADEYKKYQKRLCGAITKQQFDNDDEKTPFFWEMVHWSEKKPKKEENKA